MTSLQWRPTASGPPDGPSRSTQASDRTACGSPTFPWPRTSAPDHDDSARQTPAWVRRDPAVHVGPEVGARPPLDAKRFDIDVVSIPYAYRVFGTEAMR